MNKPNLDQAITETTKLIENIKFTVYPKFHQFDKVYLYTTEFIRGYLEQEKYNKGRALTVLSSGDHVFNLIHEGVEDIDAFDINELTYYMFWLKLAAIIHLSYDEYLKALSSFFYLNEPEMLKNFLDNIKSSLPDDVRSYFYYIMSYLESHRRAFGIKLVISGHGLRKHDNIYTDSEYEYKKLQKRLANFNIEFYFGDARSLPEKLAAKYDIILLSNIADYLHQENKLLTLEEFEAYIQGFYNLLNDDGVLINYFFGRVKGEKEPLIPASLINLENIGKENVAYLRNGLSYYRVRKKS